MNMLPAEPVLRIRSHRAGAGLAWVRQGLRLYARQPLVLVVLVGLGPLFLGTLQIVPIFGDFAALVLTPVIALGMLDVCRTASLGAVPALGSYVLALRDPVARLRLLQLGLVYAMFAALVAIVFSFAPAEHAATPPAGGTPAPGAPIAAAPGGGIAAGGALPPGQGVASGAGAADSAAGSAPPGGTAAPGTPAPPELPGGTIPAPVIIALLAILVPFAMMVWFAPALSGWYRMAVPKALFFSFFACWRNRWPILVYLLSLLGLWIIAVMFVGAIINVLNARQGLAPYLLVAPLLFLTLAVSQCVNFGVVQAIVDDGVGDAPAEDTPSPASGRGLG